MRQLLFLLNFALKHRVVGTHIRNNPLHCSQLLSELLVFELNFCKYRPMFIRLYNESVNSI